MLKRRLSLKKIIGACLLGMGLGGSIVAFQIGPPVTRIIILQMAATDLTHCRFNQANEKLRAVRFIDKYFKCAPKEASQPFAMQVTTFLKEGRILDARAVATENLDLLKKTKSRGVEILSAVNLLAQTYRVDANYPETRRLYNQALDEAKNFESAPSQLGAILYQMSVLNIYFGNYKDATVTNDQMSQLYKKTLPPDSIYQGDALAIRSDIAESEGRYKTAEDLAAQALDWREKHSGRGSKAVKSSLGQLITLYLGAQQFTDADKTAATLITLEKADPEDACENNFSISELLDLANVEIHKNNFEQAERYSGKAYDIAVKTLGKNHPYRATCLTTLGAISRHRHHVAEAKVQLLEALAIYRTTLGAKNRLIAKALAELGATYRNGSDFSKSEFYYQQSISMCKQLLPPDHPLLAAILQSYAEMLEENHLLTASQNAKTTAENILTAAQNH